MSDTMKKGLILEGGAMRGLFTAGVTDVMMEEKITFDAMIGVSAGAAFGCNYKSGQIGRARRYNKKYCRDKRYCSLHSLITTGDLYGADFCYRKLPEELDLFDNEAFEKNPMEFYVVCTDVNTGKAVYKKIEDSRVGLQWFRASASMPLVSRIVEIDGEKYLDGGIADSIPVKFFEKEGFTRNVVVLTRPKGYIKKKSSLMPLIRCAMRKFPKMAEAMANRHKIYNETTAYIEEKEKKGEILVIRPSKPLPVKRTEKNPENLEKAYQAGREEAKKRIEEIKEFLSR